MERPHLNRTGQEALNAPLAEPYNLLRVPKKPTCISIFSKERKLEMTEEDPWLEIWLPQCQSAEVFLQSIHPLGFKCIS